MPEYSLAFQGAETTGEQIESSHFGANALHSVNFYHNGRNYEPEAGFASSVETYSINHIRYPGGHVESTIDVTNMPNGNLRPEVREFLEWCDANSTLDQRYEVTFVLPTKMNIPGQQIEDFVYALLSEYGHLIKALEIGNEYSIGPRVDNPDRSTHPEYIEGSNFIAAMNEFEYGRSADNVINSTQDAIDRLRQELGDSAPDPLILLQMAETNGAASAYKGGADAGNYSLANEAILESMSSRARDAVDGAVVHYYYNVSREEGQTFGDVDDWRETRRIQERYDDFVEQLGRDVDLFVTEWNVVASNYTQHGAASASVLLEMFEFMVRMDVDDAHIWPLQHRTTNNIFGNRESTDLEYSMSGAVFSMMVENLHPRLSATGNADIFESQISSWLNSTDEVEINHYASSYRDVVYVSLRSDLSSEITLDLGDLMSETSIASLERLTIDRESSDGLSDFANESGQNRISRREISQDELDQLETLAFFDATNANHVHISNGRILTYLPPIETILPLVDEPSSINDYYFTSEVDVEPLIETLAPPSDVGPSLNFTLMPYDVVQIVIDQVLRDEGSDAADRIIGGIGRDFQLGREGNDTLRGGEDHDTLKGGWGDDWLRGDQGDDELVDGEGNDLMEGGLGNDSAHSSGGADRLLMGDGDDAIYLQSSEVFGSGLRALHVPSVDFQAWYVNVAGMNRYEVVSAGGTGQDRIMLGGGNDALFLDDVFSDFHASLDNAPSARIDSIELIRAGAGNDLLDMTSDRYQANTPGMTLRGEDGHDTIWGTPGEDTIIGGAGDDHLEGGGGQDILTGGSGADSFHFVAQADRMQIITDFDADQGDRIVLHQGERASHSFTSQGSTLYVWDQHNNLVLSLDVGTQAAELAEQGVTAEWLEYF